MSALTDWRERARAMRAADPTLNYSAIGRATGVSKQQVWRLFNPEKVRAENARRRRYKREWEKAQRATCDRCGEPMGPGTARADGSRARAKAVGDRCQPCRTELRVKRVLAMAHLRITEGLDNRAIAERLDLPVVKVTSELYRLRTLGFDVPTSTYHNVPATGANYACPRSTAPLGKALAARGIHPPTLPREAA